MGTTPKKAEDFKIGDRVLYLPGPRSSSKRKGVVTGFHEVPSRSDALSVFIVVVDDEDGKVRKVRPGSAAKLAV